MEIRVFGKKMGDLPIGNLLNYTRNLEAVKLIEYLRPTSNDTVLDVACGDGYWTRRLLQRTSEVVGIDCNPKRIAQAGGPKNSRLHLLVSSAEELPFIPHTFDKIISICALEHFADDEKALREMAQVLKPGGTIGLSVDSLSLPWLDPAFIESHKWRYSVRQLYTLEELSKKLDICGFWLTDHCFLTISRLSSAILRFASRYRRISYVLFFLLYPITRISDRFFGVGEAGHKLLVRAVKKDAK